MFSSPYNAAVIQMNSQTNLDENLDDAYKLIKQAAEEGAQVVGLPENFAFLGGLSMRLEQAGEIEKQASAFLSDTAKEFEVYIIGGSYPVAAGEEKVYNHATIWGPDGEKLASYNKMHLFDVDLSDEEAYRESDYIKPGDPDPVISKNETIGNWGLTVCYDLRFPELYRKLAEQGAEIFSIPSAFTYTTGQVHWKTLLKARAIENTSYVFAPAQTGLHGKNRRTWGYAMIVDPWGNIVADAGPKPGFAMAEIDPKELQKARKRIPSLKHRRI